MPVLLDGRSLTCRDLERVARAADGVAVDPLARERVAAARAAVLAVAGDRPVYGLSTGVGANRHVDVDVDDLAGHAVRLLRSHAACTGPLEDDPVVRATLTVRLNQLLAGGSGVRPEVADALAVALDANALPYVHRYGALGTGDLAPLAEIGLTLAGERPWRSAGPAEGDAGVPVLAFAPGEALAFMSSSALTLATAALAGVVLSRMLDAGLVVAALSFLALRGNPEAYAAPVHAHRPYPGAVWVAETLRTLIGTPPEAMRIQDPFALRSVPQVNGAAVEALDRIREVIEVEVNAAVENPLVVAGGPDAPAAVFHHGQFHATEVASGLDAVRLAIASAARLSTGRLGAMLEPSLTGLPVFLSAPPSGSSGVLVLEYVAHDVLAEVQHTASPVTTGSAVISRGLEDHASFAAQAARYATELTTQLPTLLACELVAAVRALRAAPDRLGDGPVRDAYARVAEVLPADPRDRPLGDDIAAATAVLPELAAIAYAG